MPQREIFPGGTKIDAGAPKLGKVQKKKVCTQIWSRFFAHSQGRIMGRDEKNFGPKLNATTSTPPGPLDPSPGTMYPLNPPLVGPGIR